MFRHLILTKKKKGNKYALEFFPLFYAVGCFAKGGGGGLRVGWGSPAISGETCRKQVNEVKKKKKKVGYALKEGDFEMSL